MVTSESSTDAAAPSLVAHLQQAHGLTKKKVYGTKPTRQPFLHARAKYRRAPKPLAIPPSLSETAPGAVAHLEGLPSRSQYDHHLLSVKGPQASRTHRHSPSRRRSSWSRRGLRLSSPEIDASLSSPTSVSTYSTVSPVLPMLPDIDQLSETLSHHMTMSADGLSEPNLDSVGMCSLRLLDPAARLMEPTWLQSQYLSGLPLFSPSSQLSVSVVPGDGITNKDGSITPQSHLIPPCHSASLVSHHTPLLPPGSNLPSGLGRPSNIINEQPVFPLSQVAMPPAVNDGDTPFIFDAEYEAAVAARVEGLLHSSPNLLYPMPSFRNKQYAMPVSLPNPPQNNPYPLTLVPLLPASPTSGARTDQQNMLYAEFNQAMPERAAVLYKSPSETCKGGSSSLTGWAG